jgi:hypothetical protein
LLEEERKRREEKEVEGSATNGEEEAMRHLEAEFFNMTKE